MEELKKIISAKNSRFKARLFKDFSAKDLISAAHASLKLEIPDIEILTLIKHELECKKKESKEDLIPSLLDKLNKDLKENKVRPIGWLNRARKALQLLQNPPLTVYNPSHSVYVILMDYWEEDATYGVYVGETRLLVEDRFQQHINGISAGRGVQKRGRQLLRSLMLYAPRKITFKQRRIYESAVHHCLTTAIGRLGKDGKALRVKGNGKNIKPREWPPGFQLKLKEKLSEQD